MKRLLTFTILLGFLFSYPFVAYSDNTNRDFTSYILEWREKSESAQDNLLQAERYLKSGQKFNACIQQRKASRLGIEAFSSLLKAKELEGNEDDIANIQKSLKQWKRLEAC